MEANLLKSIGASGARTKVVALGIGSGVDVNELNNMASAPSDKNVILVHNFSSLTDVEEQLRNASCGNPHIEHTYSFLSFCLLLTEQQFFYTTTLSQRTTTNCGNRM